MDAVQQYVCSKGIPTQKHGWAALQEQLLAEYGFVAPVLRKVTQVEVVSLPLSELVHFPKYVESIEARSPLVADAPPIVGLVVPHEDKYRLLDGHHRLKWCLEHQWVEGTFILLT